MHHTVHMPTHPPKYLTVSELAEIEKVSRWTIVRRIKDGHYRNVVETPSQYLIPTSSVKSLRGAA